MIKKKLNTLGFEHDLNYSHWIESAWKLHSHCNITDGELYNSPLAIKTRSMKIPPCPTKINQLPIPDGFNGHQIFDPLRWCGSKEAAHTCDLVHSVVFLRDLMVVSEGA